MNPLQKDLYLKDQIHLTKYQIDNALSFDEIMALRNRLSILLLKQEFNNNRLKGEFKKSKIQVTHL